MPDIQTTTQEVSFDTLLSTLTGGIANDKKEEEKRDFFSMNNTSFDAAEIVNPSSVVKEIPTEDMDSVDDELDEDTKVDKVVNPTEVVDSLIQNTNVPDKDDIQINDLNSIYNELVKDELLVGYDDDKPLTSIKEFKYLLAENKNRIRQEVINEELPQFVDSLPDDVQAIVKYATEGGKDLKGMYKALAEVEEFRQFEVKENDLRSQEEIAIKYLKATNYAKGDDEEIKEVIEEWKDNGTLYKRSKKFKGELDEMHEQLVSQKLAEQEQRSKLEEKRSMEQKQAIYDSIVKDNDLNGIKVDKQTQGKLFTGLTQKAWKNEQGENIDMLDALIEYYRVKQPNFKLLGEALYLLLEPDTYKSKLATEAKQKEKSDTMRTLKTEQSRRAVGNNTPQENQTKGGIKRTPSNNFWK